MDKLSEKEKKAIDYYINNEYSFGFETDMDIESFKKAIGIEETDEDTWEKHQIRFKTLLNLIEKQEKVINEMAKTIIKERGYRNIDEHPKWIDNTKRFFFKKVENDERREKILRKVEKDNE